MFQHEVGRFYLMVNQILINAGDRIGFQQNMENCPSKKQLFSIYIQPVKLIFGEEPLHTPRKKSFGGKSPISTYLERYRDRKSKV